MEVESYTDKDLEKEAGILGIGSWILGLLGLGSASKGVYDAVSNSRSKPKRDTGPGLGVAATGGTVLAGLLLNKLLEKEKTNKLDFPNKIVVDVPIQKTASSNGVETEVKAIPATNLIDSWWSAIPMFGVGALGVPLLYNVLTSLSSVSKDREQRKIQDKLDKLRHIALPYQQEIEKSSNAVLDLFLDKLSDRYASGDDSIEKAAGIMDTIESAIALPGKAAGWLVGGVKPALSLYGLLLGGLAGAGYLAGNKTADYFTYDPMLERMKLEDTYGNMVEPMENIPIEINPVLLQGLSDEEKKRRLAKMRAKMKRQSDGISNEINIDEVLG